MKTYQYYSQIFTSEVQVSYNTNGLLCAFKILNHEDIKSINTQQKEFKNYFLVNDFLAAAQVNKLIYTEVERVVTFEMFWDAYKQKDCGRTKGEECWKKLSKAQQIQAFDFIPSFNGILKNSNTAKPYANTYLNQKRWIR